MYDFRKSVVYQIYPKSFCDTNGDGLGDLRGVTAKLDYLKTLGVDYIWMTPFFVSPQRDNGYDVADYRNIDPRFGTMEDFETLCREAKARDIRVMLDMVFNHTSTEHEWFQKALAGDPKYENYYIWKDGEPDTPPNNWQSKFGGSAWAYVPEKGKWYLHLFDPTQADLNWENPDVRHEVQEVIRFWMSKGVKGFRFDVVNLISKGSYESDDQGDGRRFYTDGPRVHEYLHELNQATFGTDAEIVTVGEMSSTSMENCYRYAGADTGELSMTFSFHHLKVDFVGNEKWVLVPFDFQKLKDILFSWQTGMTEHNAWNAVFWCNHDQPRVVSRFGDEGEYWKQSAKMLGTVIHCLRGTPYVYQGDLPRSISTATSRASTITTSCAHAVCTRTAFTISCACTPAITAVPRCSGTTAHRAASRAVPRGCRSTPIPRPSTPRARSTTRTLFSTITANSSPCVSSTT